MDISPAQIAERLRFLHLAATTPHCDLQTRFTSSDISHAGNVMSHSRLVRASLQSAVIADSATPEAASMATYDAFAAASCAFHVECVLQTE